MVYSQSLWLAQMWWLKPVHGNGLETSAHSLGRASSSSSQRAEYGRFVLLFLGRCARLRHRGTNELVPISIA